MVDEWTEAQTFLGLLCFWFALQVTIPSLLFAHLTQHFRFVILTRQHVN
jgi:hypothetical protein